MDKPKDYTELHLDLAVVCTNQDRQAIILMEPVGGLDMYTVYGADRIERHPDETAPTLSQPLLATEFFGAALRKARAWCGWDWYPHPDKPEDMP